MAVTIAYLPPMKKAGKTLLWSVTGFGVATILFGLLSRISWFSLAIGGLGTILVVTGVATTWPQTRKIGALDKSRRATDMTAATSI
jgi:hypothetical protein